MYLRGNINYPPDLKRASAEFAVALFLINSRGIYGNVDEEEEIRMTRTQDAELLMHALISKNSFPGLPIFAQVQDSLSKDLSNHCGCDRVIPCEEIQASLYAANCVVPGVQALIPNLVHGYQLLDDCNLTDFWMKEYQYGISMQIQSFKIPKGLIGLRFKDFVLEIYRTFSTMVFALVSLNSGFIQNPMRAGIDGNYRMKHDDVAICITDGGDETMLRISLQYKQPSPRLISLAQKELEDDINKFLEPSNSPVSEPIKQSYTDTVNLGESFSLGYIDPEVNNHIIICGRMNTRLIRHFVKTIRSQPSNTLCPGKIKSYLLVICILETIPNELNLGAWSEILAYENIFICQGTAMKRTTLEKAHIARCSQVVLFAENSSETKDATTVFMVKILQKVRNV